MMSKKNYKNFGSLDFRISRNFARAIVMWIFGYDAIWGYEDCSIQLLVASRGIGEIFRAMGPFVLIGLGFAVASRAGFF